jgi:CO/xanthine dehydrogenase Mo-binding subunit
MAGVPTVAAAATGAVAGPPDPSRIDSWIAVHPDNTATVFLGKCELGQGNTTGLLQIAGEELDLDMSQLATVRLDTNVSPNQGATCYHVELIDPSWRPAGTRRRGGGAPGASAARLDAARRPDRQPHGFKRRGVDRR